MANPLLIPPGARIEILEDGLLVENDGDITLSTDLGKGLRRVRSASGSVTLIGDFAVGQLEAAGAVHLTGNLRVESLQAGGDLRFSGELGADQLDVGGDVTGEGALLAQTLRAGGGVSLRGPALSVDELRSGGDLTIDGDLSATLIEAAGGLIARGALNAESVTSGGAIALHGGAMAHRLLGQTIVHSGDLLTAKGVQATESISLGAGEFKIDVLLAPQIEVAAEARGRVTVIECDGEVGPNSLKGGFTLSEAAEFFGDDDPDQFLASRGLSRTPDLPARGPAPIAFEVDTDPELGGPDPIEAAVATEQPGDDLLGDDDELLDDDDEVFELDPEAVQVEIEVDEEQGSSRAELLQLMEKLDECYQGGQEPPALGELRSLLTDGDLSDLSTELVTIWNSLLRHHQLTSLRMPHRVGPAFNSIRRMAEQL